ncbi:MULTISPECIES: hypothetical protein [Mesorhizobium]|nr:MULTISPECIES: hypothetical protein [Mesorhizobium]MDF3208389.1 hypothetical protein [Mesorhizobium sp. LMG15046]MDF3229040.1 hypothetical protein [Mesorhizobium sp. DSM 30133]
MIRTLMRALRRLFVADPVKEFLGEWGDEIEQEARKRRNTDA